MKNGNLTKKLLGFRTNRKLPKTLATIYCIFSVLFSIFCLFLNNDLDYSTKDKILTKVSYFVFSLCFILPYLWLGDIFKTKTKMVKSGKKILVVLIAVFFAIAPMFLSISFDSFKSNEFKTAYSQQQAKEEVTDSKKANKEKQVNKENVKTKKYKKTLNNKKKKDNRPLDNQKDTSKTVLNDESLVDANIKFKCQCSSDAPKKVIVYIDEKKIGTLLSDVDNTFSVKLKKGNHELRYVNYDDNKLMSKVQFENSTVRDILYEIYIGANYVTTCEIIEEDSEKIPENDDEFYTSWVFDDLYTVGNVKFRLTQVEVISKKRAENYLNGVRIHLDVIQGDRNKLLNWKYKTIGKIVYPNKSYEQFEERNYSTILRNVDLSFGTKDDERISASKLTIENNSDTDVIIQGMFWSNKQLKDNSDFNYELYFYCGEEKLEVSIE